MTRAPSNLPFAECSIIAFHVRNASPNVNKPAAPTSPTHVRACNDGPTTYRIAIGTWTDFPNQIIQAGKALLKSDYEEGTSVEACLKLAVKVLNKTMDSTTPTPEKMEFTTITRVNGKAS